MKRLTMFLLLPILVFSACKPEVSVSSPTPAVTEAAPTAIDTPIPTDTPTPTATPTPSGPSPEPQEVTFQAADGQQLSGLYYPAAVSPAPLVVLMHWVNGNMSDWYEVAVWLQNRGQANPFPNPGDAPWWDPSWFPPVPADRSYGVFIFSFRNCEPNPHGCANWEPEGWLLDAQAAMLTASELEGVDRQKIVAIGSSIGADGAVDGCFWLNEQEPGFCQGALSLSPGDYLGIAYADAVRRLEEEEPVRVAWCLYGAEDVPSQLACQSAAGEQYKAYEFPGDAHGNGLLSPGFDPLPMQLILDFLEQTIAP